MPEENSIFMKTSSRALGILTQLHAETAQAMYDTQSGGSRKQTKWLSATRSLRKG